MNSSHDIKTDLKDVLREHLDRRVSQVFLEQTFAIIDQSAINKESFAVAADRVSKRIALFIDVDLSQKIYNSLLALIGATSSPQGVRRRYPRIHFRNTVQVTHNGKRHELVSENISEIGIFIKTDDPFPINAKVEIILSLDPGQSAAVKGVVVNKKSSVPGISRGTAGMGIELKEIDTATAELLRDYIRRHS